ncbi:MAG: hypothetical protein GPJ52_13505 [Candidatus Heimdallarchaeota archaeon]|nr:hypothetical protein [Candidatus Heimdallarchaeota archaeon]
MNKQVRETETQLFLKIIFYVINILLIPVLIYWNWLIRYVLSWGIIHGGWEGYNEPFYVWNIVFFMISPALVYGFTTGFFFVKKKERIIFTSILSTIVASIQVYFVFFFVARGYTQGAILTEFIPVLLGPIINSILFVCIYFLSRIISRKRWEKTEKLDSAIGKAKTEEV